MRFLFFLTALLLSILACENKQNSSENVEKRKSQDKNSTVYLRLSAQPESLHPVRASDAFSNIIHKKTMETLLERSIKTNLLEPSLAEKWEISSDYKTYTFYLRKNTFWHDGKPVTAEDAVFSLTAHKDVKYGGAHHISYFENIEGAEALSQHAVKFYAKKKYFGSFEKLSTFLKIIPKHIYEGKTEGLNRVLVGSGPYKFSSWDGNKKIVLTKNQNWWGLSVKKGQYNFKNIVYRIIKDSQDTLLRMEQDQLDYIGLSSESYFKRTSRPPWGKTILKKRVKNLAPKAFSFIGWNLQKSLFKDKKVRRALSHLMNRKLMNDKFHNNSLNLAAGPVYQQSEYADPSVKPIDFSPKKALELLRQAGWSDSDKNGFLDKKENGKIKEFRFTLIYTSKDSEKYFTIYQQDLKKSGIDMSLRMLDWTPFLKAVDDRNFSALSLAWQAEDVEWHPKQILHSKSIQNRGSNFVGYSNPEVDRLIDASNTEMNREKRVLMLRKVYRLIAEDQPYSFMFSPKYSFYAHSKRVFVEKPTYKYGVGFRFWRFH